MMNVAQSRLQLSAKASSCTSLHVSRLEELAVPWFPRAGSPDDTFFTGTDQVNQTPFLLIAFFLSLNPRWGISGPPHTQSSAQTSLLTTHMNIGDGQEHTGHSKALSLPRLPQHTTVRISSFVGRTCESFPLALYCMGVAVCLLQPGDCRRG